VDEVEIEIGIERGIDCIGRYRNQQRIAVRCRRGGEFGADIAGGARPVVDNELLAEPMRQIVGDDAGDNVGRGAGGPPPSDARIFGAEKPSLNPPNMRWCLAPAALVRIYQAAGGQKAPSCNPVAS
jgi:hypothetical protein